RLGGVLLDYARPALVGSSGSILGDQPYIHEDVAADFLVFRPRPGSLVRGRINKMTRKHLGCLVHERVPVSVLLPDRPWPELLPYLRMGQELICRVASVSLFRGSILRLRAHITRECLQVMLETVPVARASHEEELEEYESSYGGDSEWDEGGASEAEEDPRGPSYLDPEEDFTTGRPLPLAAEDPKTPSGRKGARRAKRKQPGEDGASSTGGGGTLGLLGSDGLDMWGRFVAADSASDCSTQLEKKKKKKKAEFVESRETSPASPARPKKKKLLNLDKDDEALLTFQNSISFLRKGKSKTGKHGQM
ncbi:unnamed protein product, partial [Ixodes pacificus]